MGDDLSPEAKAELLWRDFEERRRNPPQSLPHIDRILVWLLIAANALGMGPEAVSNILKALSK